MKRQEQVKRNMELFSIFMMKALNSPELRDQVPTTRTSSSCLTTS
jgi:hypothetical protein